MSSRAVDMGYSQTGTSTIGFLQKIESADDSGAPLAAQLCSPHADPAAAGEKYKALIRQLPSRPLLVTLKDLYFRHFNWYYYFLEEAIFDEQLEQWNNLPFSALGDPMNLPDELRAFPALLFQVIATALLVLPDEPGLDLKKFEALKYSSSMTWDNLASDYSENGMAVLRLFKKRHVALTTVQAQFTRTAFMKYSAEVADSVSADFWAEMQHNRLEVLICDSGTCSPVRSEMLKNWASTVIPWILNRRTRAWKVFSRISGLFRSEGKCS